MPRDLVPELHDVLKLTTLKHNFEDFANYQSLAPKTPTWRGVLQHHCDEAFPAYPTDRQTFLLHVADGLASNFSRHPQNIQQDVNFQVHRLWNPSRDTRDQRLSEPSAIRQMLEFLATDPSFEDFYQRYESIFRSRAEDAHPGMNITTLETHVRLVGKFYRILCESKSFSLDDSEVESAAREGVPAVAKLRQQKARDWQMHILECRLRLLASPFRARDMNVFAALEEFLSDVRNKLGDRLLFSSSQELLLFSDTQDVSAELRKLAALRGIALELYRDRQRMDMLSLELRKPQTEALYPDLDPTVIPPLCEICQLKAATKTWPDDYLASRGTAEDTVEAGKDFLCETCFSIRSRPSRLQKLAHWEEWAEGDLVWMRVGLDFDQLRRALKLLYLDYLRSLDPNTPQDKATVRFSLIAEFQRDYESFLSHLSGRIVNDFGEGRIERILPEIYCLCAEAGSDTFGVLRCFLHSLKEFFPAFLGDVGSPIRVSLAYCGLKYPFFEVWRQWQEQEAELEIIAVGHGRLRLEMRSLEKFLQLADYPFRKSALHNLAEIALVSQRLAELRFRSAEDKGERETFGHLKEFLPLGLTFDGILTLAKLAKD